MAHTPTMSEDTLSFDEGRKQTKALAESTKTYQAELPEGGIWEFEYGMVASIDRLMDKHVNVNAKDGSVDMGDMFEFQAELFCEGVKDAPDGFPLSKTKLQRQDPVVKEIVREVADRIEEFSSADEVTIRKFQGVGNGSEGDVS